MSSPLIDAFIAAQLAAAQAAAQAAIAAALASNPSANSATLAAAATTAATTQLSTEVSTLREQRQAYLTEALQLRAENAALKTRLNETLAVWVPQAGLPPAVDPEPVDP